MIVEVVRFDGEWVALVSEQNEWTGNYSHDLRIIHGGYGEEWIKYNGYKVSIRNEVEMAREYEAGLKSLRTEVERLKRIVGR